MATFMTLAWILIRPNCQVETRTLLSPTTLTATKLVGTSQFGDVAEGEALLGHTTYL